MAADKIKKRKSAKSQTQSKNTGTKKRTRKTAKKPAKKISKKVRSKGKGWEVTAKKGDVEITIKRS
ncbi:MAG: hypothetical protein WBR15_09065 [Gammaproteobacteria bacterium]